jgi:glycosyltransferase involved in cell wall biosynthesis
MGGIIYIINLIKALNCLDDDEKPEIVLFYNAEMKKYLNEFEYPYIKLVETSFPSIVKEYLSSWIKGKNVFLDGLVKEHSLDAIYPVRNYPLRNKSDVKLIAWYADLQHKYYPEFFSKKVVLHRDIRLFFMLRNTNDLVVSSQAVKDDFMKFYKCRKELKFHIYHFVSINDDFQDVSIEELREKYKLPEKYFMVSNQFHKHKNHTVLLLTLTKLKEMGIKKHMAMTGKFPAAANSPYIAELHRIIEENDLHDQISFLGLIPRKDQLQLMNNSQAVLQPSLFEGWSTVNEDAISIQVPVIAANLPVNIEQLEDKGIYFEPHNVDELTNILKNYPDRDFTKNIYGDYSKRRVEAVRVLMDVLKK